MDILYHNPSNIAMCFPARYLHEPISKSTFILKNGEPTDFQVVADLTDSPPALPDTLSKHIDLLRGEPNVIVQPRSTLHVSVSTGEKYRIPIGEKLTVHLQLFLYPCDIEQYKRNGYFHLQPVAVLGFERAHVAGITR